MFSGEEAPSCVAAPEPASGNEAGPRRKGWEVIRAAYDANAVQQHHVVVCAAHRPAKPGSLKANEMRALAFPWLGAYHQLHDNEVDAKPLNTSPFSVPGVAEEGQAEPIGAELIGAEVRRLRTERQLTIAQLAQKAGVASGLISQIERGKSNPSIKTLQRLRAALGVNLWEFLEGRRQAADPGSASAGEDEFVRRKERRPRIVVGKSRLVKELLSPRNDANLRFMIITLPPGGESEDVIIGEGEKGGLVIHGTVELTVGTEVFQLREGDSCQFPSSLPHSICNKTKEAAKIIWIMSVLDSHI